MLHALLDLGQDRDSISVLLPLLARDTMVDPAVHLQAAAGRASVHDDPEPPVTLPVAVHRRGALLEKRSHITLDITDLALHAHTGAFMCGQVS